MTKILRCRVGLHRWHKIYDHNQGKRFKECRDCGKRMGTGWPMTLGG